MNTGDVTIRDSRDDERDQILAVHTSAFGDDEGPVIAKLVDEMLDDASGEPILSLVAEVDTQLVGHVLFTSASIEPDQEQVIARILAPLAIIPSHQRQQIGSRLIQTGLRLLKHSGVNFVFVLGHPAY